jgi:L-malate glycosyltransferase
MKRILAITPALYGGAGKFIVSLVTSLKGQGFDFDLLTSDVKGDYKDWELYLKNLLDSRITIHYLDFFHRDSAIFWQNCEVLSKIIKQGDFDLIHTHSAVPTLGATIALEIIGKQIPVLATFYSFGINRPRWMDFSDYYSFGKADKVIAISGFCRDLLIDNCIPESKVDLIPIGIDIAEVEKYKDHRLKIRKQIGFTDDVILLVQIAAVERRKNQLMSIRILENMKNKSNKKFKLLLAGDKKEKDYVDEITEYIESNKLDKDVILTGKIENPYGYLYASDIFIFPTLSEGLGLALIEAMAAGIPVFSTFVEGTKDIVIDNENAVVISSNDSQITTKKILKFIDDDKRKNLIVNNAYSFIKKHFDISMTFNRYIEIYNKF